MGSPGIDCCSSICRLMNDDGSLGPDGPDAAVGLAECAATTNLFFSSSIAACFH